MMKAGADSIALMRAIACSNVPSASLLALPLKPMCVSLICTKLKLPAGSAPAVRQLESKGGGRAIEPRDLVGNDHLGPELLRLHKGAAGQRLAGDAFRKSEKVLD